jgi:hypothetical protein
MSSCVLDVYLKDHLAGATAGVALAQRVAHVADEIVADRETLERLRRTRRARLAVEKCGRMGGGTPCSAQA